MSPVPVSGTAKNSRRKKPGYITYDFLSHFPLPVLFPGGGQRGTNVSHPARISRKAEQISAQYPQNSARKGCNWKNKILIEFVTSVVIPVLIENIVSGPDMQAMFDNVVETAEKNHTSTFFS